MTTGQRECRSRPSPALDGSRRTVEAPRTDEVGHADPERIYLEHMRD